jgi:NSS family neurotransmitter:Na+ symporter
MIKNDVVEQFSTRWGMLVSVLGIAVGTGNIWRFPRIAASNSGDDGAGAFLVAWVVFLLMWSIPLIIAEYAIGRAGRKGTIGSFIKVGGPQVAWMGAFVGFVAMGIMFYYSVVTGWCFYYFGTAITGGLPADADGATALWDGFQAGWLPVALHALAMGLGGWVVLYGVKSIERVNKILIPSLVLILLISLVRALTLPGSGQGIAFLFTPDWSTLASPTVWLEALTQNAWDTGAGWGLILTYAAYMRRQENVTVSALQTGIGNNLVSLVCAMIIFSTVFGTLGATMSESEILTVMQESGPNATGLTFMWMPRLFADMPGGTFIGILFFLGLSAAAFSSLISMIELSAKLFIDRGISRRSAVIGIVGVGFLLGIPSAVSGSVFGNQDFVWGLGLMISGAFIAVIAIRYGVGRFRVDLINADSEGLQAGVVIEKILKYGIPIQVIVLLGWWIWRSATQFAPDTWYDPFDPYSVMTCLVQWGILAGVLIASNKKLNDA